MDDQEQNSAEDQGTNANGSGGNQACAEIYAHDVWINNDGPDPILKAGQPFTMMAEVCNQGPNSSGLFKAKFVLDGGADSVELQCPNLDAGQCVWMSWPYPQGTTAGDHTFEAYFDIYHEVPCDDQSNNYTSYSPFNIADAPTSDGSDANQQAEPEQQYA
jgi:CARDB